MKRNVLLFISVLLLAFLLNCNPTSSNNNNVSTAPDSPVLSSPSNGATSIPTMPTLTWGTVSGATTYRVQISTVSTFATTVINDSSITVGSKTLTTTLSNSTKYYWRANAKNSVGTGSWSTAWNFTTSSTSVPASPILTSPTNGATSISTTPTLTWSTVSGATTYRVQVSTISTFATTVANDSSLTVGSKTLTTGLSNSTKYYWRVNAKNTTGTSAWSSAWSFTTAGTASVPGVPTISSPSNGATSISITPTLTWSIVSGASTYRVQVSTVSTFTTTVINDSSLTVGSKTLTTALNNNTKYYWRFYANINIVRSSWSTVWSFTTRQAAISGPTVTDVDGNVYHSVVIGTQTWTVENLKTTKYNDGTSIPLVTDNTSWGNLTTPGCCWYNNDAATYKNTYGALYNWYVVHTGKLAPAGWHVPTAAEWDTLENYLIANGYNYDGTTTGNKIAKSMASQVGWDTNSPNSTLAGAIGNDLRTNNRSGFSAFPGGFRVFTNGGFSSIGFTSDWWSATEVNASSASDCFLDYAINGTGTFDEPKSYGFSVRLVKN